MTTIAKSSLLCSTDGCERLKKRTRDGGWSKYCPEHAAVARQVWRDNIAAQQADRAERYDGFAKAFAAAHQAGRDAAEASRPQAMVVAQHQNPMDDNSPIEMAWVVPEGVCGFAWVTIRPGNSSLAKYAVAHHGFRKAYYGGVELWVHGYGQSMTRKEAYADAYAATLRSIINDPKVSVTSGSRMD